RVALLLLGLEQKRAVAISAPRLARRVRRDEPTAVLGMTEQRRETGVRIKPGKAAPVDRPATMNKRRRLQVRQKRVVLDQSGHREASRLCPGPLPAWNVAQGMRIGVALGASSAEQLASRTRRGSGRNRGMAGARAERPRRAPACTAPRTAPGPGR